MKLNVCWDSNIIEMPIYKILRHIYGYYIHISEVIHLQDGITIMNDYMLVKKITSKWYVVP